MRDCRKVERGKLAQRKTWVLQEKVGTWAKGKESFVREKEQKLTSSTIHQKICSCQGLTQQVAQRLKCWCDINTVFLLKFNIAQYQTLRR